MSLATGNELNAETFNEFVQRLGHHVRGEGVDWHHTADAIFTVQYREIIFGIDRDYTDKLAVGVDESMYFSPKEYWDEADEDLRARLDEIADEEGETKFLSLDESDQWDILGELPEHTVSGWDERWVHLNSHFTKEAAEAFIARKKHDYRKGLRVYVEAQVYCWEFNAIIRGLLDGQIVFAQAATEAAKATGTAQTKQSSENIEELPEPDYRAGTKGLLCEDAWARETVEAYGQACAEAARQPAPALPVKDEILNARQEGRMEALAIILREDAESPFNDQVICGPNDDAGDYSTYWNEEALRKLLYIDDAAYNAFDKAEEQYWDYRGYAIECEIAEDQRRTALEATAAPVLPKNPLYTCIGKGGEYELIGTAQGAGTMKKLDDMRIYRAGNRLYYRTTDDFDARMQRIAATRSQP